MKQPLNKPINANFLLSIEFGIIGGMLLIAASAFFQNGYLQIAVYPLVLLPLAFALNHRLQKRTGFFKRLIGGWMAFLLMSAMYYIYVIFIGQAADSAFWVHMVRILAILVIGAASSVLLTLIVRWINPVMI